MAVPGGNNKGPCYWCFKAVKWIPVLFIVTIVVWSYYAYVIQLCLLTVDDLPRRIFYLIFFHMFFFMFFWSYWQTIFTDIGRVPSKGDLPGMGRFHILFLFFVAVMFAISLLSLFGYHCYLVIENRTTLEAFRPPNFRDVGPDKYGFHIGRYKNFQEVFGDDPMKWFFPLDTSLGNGLEYPVHSRLQPSTYRSMDITPNSEGDGITFAQRQMEEDLEGLLHVNYEDEHDSV
uniref:Palmitoyltransferase ZDHHC15B-like isoform X6 n=1 Tax=Diabrotica virgifera virgifera TaxID=50390 RepID=A0A6P7GCK4_DIAVI